MVKHHLKQLRVRHGLAGLLEQLQQLETPAVAGVRQEWMRSPDRHLRAESLGQCQTARYGVNAHAVLD